MIEEATRARVAEPPAVPGRWRRWWPIGLILAIVAAGGVVAATMMTRSSSAPVIPMVAPSMAGPVQPSTATSPTTKPPEPQPSLRLPGAVPTHGSGTFMYANTRGPVFGGKGTLRRFRVAVEKGSNEDATDFARQVAATLGDRRSWTGGGTLRLQMVAGTDQADFTVLLATRDTAGQLCEHGGTNIRLSGVPYTSCRTTGRAIINLDRWRLSSPPYVAAKIPLATYRQYVINHEVGHELGHHHQGCPKAGGPAPVMVQQTLTLRGCVANAWPRVGNGWLTGPPV